MENRLPKKFQHAMEKFGEVVRRIGMSVHAVYSPKVSLEPETFENVYKAELNHLVTTATFLLGTQAEAEEVVHDGFMKLHSNWFSVRNPGGFVRTAVVNRCKDLMRKQKRSDRHLRLVSNATTARTKDSTNHYLVDVLQQLTPRRRAVVVLKYYGGYTINEIAEMLALAEGTVRSNLYRGLAELKEELNHE